MARREKVSGSPVDSNLRTASCPSGAADIEHLERLYSLDNVFNESEMQDWLDRTPVEVETDFWKQTPPQEIITIKANA